MKWGKKGIIYKTSQRTYVPTPYVFDDKIRIYFAVLGTDMIGRVTFIDVDIKDPKHILYVHDDYCLDIGKPGMFDEHGVTPSCVINHFDKLYMYYIGWMKTTEAPQLTFSGLAISTDNGYIFKKYSTVPILDRTKEEFITRSGPFVIKENENLFRVWYNSNMSGFEAKYNNKDTSFYSITHAISSNGIDFERNTKHIELKDGEFGLGRCCIKKDGDKDYKMWYGIRRLDTPYRIGYAESENGLVWERKDDKVGIDVSENGWDSDMICMPSIVDVEGKRLMFYNGNNYGETGFGFAELQKD
jgi:hypothetical protein